jgi:hypothetical protein
VGGSRKLVFHLILMIRGLVYTVWEPKARF